MTQTFYSNGKLFLAGEYVVLDGALALALPTKFGQDLVVEAGENKTIAWKSFDQDGSIWFESELTFNDIKNGQSSTDLIKNTLLKILHEAANLNPLFLESEGYSVTTHLTFPRSWGLGTSSTLINNIAQWAHVDAYELLANSFGGSGYDIACAQNDSPVFFQLKNGKPTVEIAAFDPPFKDHLYFVYLNKKQNSKSAIAAYHKNKLLQPETLTAISFISRELLQVNQTGSFAALLENHETVLGELLQTEKVKTTLFPDFEGTVKSLGAWGGDFVLAVSEKDPTNYFKDKGYETVIPYREMIL